VCAAAGAVFAADPASPGSRELAGVAAPAAGPASKDWRFSFREDARNIFSTRTLKYLGAGGLLTAAAHAVEDVDQQEHTFERLGQIPDFGNTYGSSTVVIGGTASLALLGWGTGSSTFKSAAVDMARSYTYSVVLVGALKATVDRTRPDGEPHSFPSGHSAVAFSAAPVIAHHFGVLAGAAAYACATATLMGRMEDRRHYLSDVVFGAAIGLAMGEAVVAQRPSASRHVMVEPDRVGLVIEF
jgi:hypothetical protein